MADTPYGGAYGLTLPQFGASAALVDAPDHWRSWTLRHSPERLDGVWRWDDGYAELPVQPSGRAVIDASTATTTLHAVLERPDALLHPYLSSTALAVATWRGELGLHAGVVERNGRAWGLLGERGAGKSSTLWWWLTNAGGMVADDLLLTDGARVTAGPRFVDLRASAAQHWGVGEDVGVLGTRRRWRVPVAPVPVELPLAGLVELAWAPDVSVTPVPVAERLDVVHRHRGLRFAVDDDRVSTMRVLARPMLRFARPKRWDAVAEAGTVLLAALDAVG